jgi:hypothetical protein
VWAGGRARAGGRHGAWSLEHPHWLSCPQLAWYSHPQSRGRGPHWGHCAGGQDPVAYPQNKYHKSFYLQKCCPEVALWHLLGGRKNRSHLVVKSGETEAQQAHVHWQRPPRKVPAEPKDLVFQGAEAHCVGPLSSTHYLTFFSLFPTFFF